jgi:hypothetical protein
MRRLAKLAGAVVGLALLGLLGLALMRDRLMAAAIELAGSEATGVETTVESLSTGILGGRVELAGLRLANPAGFSEASFLQLGGIDLAVPLATLADDPIRIEKVEIDGLELRIERAGKDLNYEPIRRQLEALQAKGGAPGEQPVGVPSGSPEDPVAERSNASAPRDIHVARVRIANWALHVDVGQPWFGAQSYSMGELVLTDLEVSGSRPVEALAAELLDRLLEAALAQLPGLSEELGSIADLLLDGLTGEREIEPLLEALAGEDREVLDALAEETERRLLEELGEAAREAGLSDESIAPLIEDAAGALKGLFGDG